MTDWFKAPRKTACEATEIATAILIPKAPAKSGSVFLKLGRYRGEDLAQASLAVACLPDKTWRVAYGSVAPTPKRCASLEKLLDHATLDASLLKQAVALVKTEVKPITDVRATKEYRMHMCEVMLERGLQAALDRSHGKGPAFGAHLI
jgi:carbon-monoxide dehydrogenase medium subunit